MSVDTRFAISEGSGSFGYGGKSSNVYESTIPEDAADNLLRFEDFVIGKMQ